MQAPLVCVIQIPKKTSCSVPYRTVHIQLSSNNSNFLESVLAQNTALRSTKDSAVVGAFSIGAVSVRQGEVLDAALKLLTRDGDKLTMIGIARAASCSKETLYKWFGDRAGLLTAAVQWQAAKVKLAQISEQDLTRDLLQERIEAFGRNLLNVLSGDVSVALNRVAVNHAGQRAAAEQDDLGTIVLENGRREMGRRLKPVLAAGKTSGLLNFSSEEDAFRTFFGLVVRDVQIRRMLGDDFSLNTQEITSDAKRAADQFFVLYGTKDTNEKSQTVL